LSANAVILVMFNGRLTSSGHYLPQLHQLTLNGLQQWLRWDSWWTRLRPSRLIVSRLRHSWRRWSVTWVRQCCGFVFLASCSAHAVWSAIGIILSSVCPSVMLCIVAKR